MTAQTRLSQRDLVADSLRFEYLSGGVTSICQPYTTGWRILPGLMCAHMYHGCNLLRFENKVEIPVPTGSLMLVAAGVYHRIDLGTPKGLSRWAHVNFYLMNNLDLFSVLDIPPVAPPEIGYAVGEAIASWIAIEQRQDLDALFLQARRQEFGFHILGILSQVCRIKPYATEIIEQHQRLDPVIDYMHTHFHKSMERNDLANIAGVSPAQFHRIFRQSIGMTPIAYLRQMRMRQAQQRLLVTSLSITEIAEQVGYTDIFVFSKCFKRYSGISPTEYRMAFQKLCG